MSEFPPDPTRDPDPTREPGPTPTPEPVPFPEPHPNRDRAQELPNQFPFPSRALHRSPIRTPACPFHPRAPSERLLSQTGSAASESAKLHVPIGGFLFKKARL